MVFTPPRFVDTNKNKSEFYSVLRRRVDGYFKENNISKHATPAMIIKTIILLSAYILPFVYILVFQPSIGISLILWSVMGFALAGVGMSIMHDANHGAYSSNKTVNSLLGHTLNLCGGAVFNWKIQHNVLHHTYTNIVELDDDIDDKLVMRFNPHSKVKWYHKFQVVYAFAFYGILTLYWALLKDFVQYSRYTKQGVNRGTKKENTIVFLKIVVSKIFYFAVFFVLPLVVLKMAILPYIMGFLLMQFIAGMVLTTIFQLAHTVEDTIHPIPNEQNNIEDNWAVHQLCTTVDFSRDNKFISWYIGGLNFQVEHHLFPTICHVHYPEVSKIVEATTKEYGIPYFVNDSFGKALGSHVRTLQRFGKLPKMDEAIG